MIGKKLPEVARNYNRRYANRPKMERENPERIVEEVAGLRAGGVALELGCGLGKNALFLAKRGFDVIAVDISETGIAQLRERALMDGVDIRTDVADIVRYVPMRLPDVVVATHVLHHLEWDDTLALIARLKQCTNPGGLHALVTFTCEGDFFAQDPTTSSFYPDRETFRELYADWDILKYQLETRIVTQSDDGVCMKNLEISMIAKRSEL